MSHLHRSDLVIESVRATVLSAIAVQRRIKRAIVELEESQAHSGLLGEYRKLNATVLRKLQHCRERTELILRSTQVTVTQLEVVATYLRLLSFVEPEYEGAPIMAH